MKKNKFIVLILMLLISILFTGATCLAAPNDEAAAYAYREELLVSYKEYWYVDGAGIESHVIYGRQYKAYTFLNGYRQLSPVIEQLPTNADGLPAGVSIHQSVKLSYEFY